MAVNHVKIPEISADPEVQARLKELSPRDDVITRREVDADRDGFLDRNEITQAWPAYQFYRVENALFSTRLLSHRHEHPPLLTIRLNNPTQTPLHLRELDAFDPDVAPGRTVDLRRVGLGSLPAQGVELNLAASLVADDARTTTVNEGIARIADYLTGEYFRAHPNILLECGITDVYRLTPRQAVLLATLIPVERIDYSRAQIGAGWDDTERVLNDESPIEQLFRWDKDGNGNGVCRNYAEIVKGVLDALKHIQEPATSRLETTYALYLRDSGLGKDHVPGSVTYHAWNGFVTLTETGLEATVLDPTWADESSRGHDPARILSNDVKLDYTRERFLTLVDYFQDQGMVDPAVLAADLMEKYLQSPPPVFRVLTPQNYQQEFHDPDPSYLIGAQILQTLGELDPLPSARLAGLGPFLKSFATALSDHARQMREVGPYRNRTAFSEDVLESFLIDLSGFVDLCQRLPDDLPSKAEAVQAATKLLTAAFDGFGFNTQIQFYRYLEMAEKMGDVVLADKCIERIASDDSYFSYGLLPTAAQAASPERWPIYRDRLDLTDVPDPDLPERYQVEQDFDYVIAGYSEEGTPQERAQQLEVFYRDVNAVTHALPPADRALLKNYPLEVTTDDRQDYFQPDRLYLARSLDQTEIFKSVSEFIRFRRAWDTFRKNCPCEVELCSYQDSREGSLVPVFKKSYAPQLLEIVAAVRDYFEQVDLGLVRYKHLYIGDDDDARDYLRPTIAIDHFIARDFAAIDRVLQGHSGGRYSALMDRKELQKKYLEVEASTFITGSVDFSDLPDDQIALVDSYHGPFKQVLDELAHDPDYAVLQDHPLKLCIRRRRFGDPAAGFSLDQQGRVELFTATNPSQAASALRQAATDQASFWGRIDAMAAAFHPNTIHLRPLYEHLPLGKINFEALGRLERLLQALTNQPEYTAGFSDLVISFDGENASVAIQAGGADGDPRREYQKGFYPLAEKTFLSQLSAFVTQVRALEHRCIALENVNDLVVTLDWGDLEAVQKCLDRAEAFFATPRPVYVGFTLALTEPGMDMLVEEIAPLIGVDRSQKWIVVKP